jgi:hypothetical protein
MIYFFLTRNICDQAKLKALYLFLLSLKLEMKNANSWDMKYYETLDTTMPHISTNKLHPGQYWKGSCSFPTVP